MRDKQALEAFRNGKKLDQPTVKRLWQEGYIEVRDVTNMQSTEQELLPTFITPEGKRLLEED
jgi:hypothetical protein